MASWTISVISHGHGDAVRGVLGDLHRQLKGRDYRIILTQNLTQPTADPLRELPQDLLDHISLRRNARPQGFGANHNAALIDADSDYVLMADPDLRLPEAIFDALELALQQPGVGIVSPRALTPQGQPEDNARPVPTPSRLLRRYLFGRQRDSDRSTSLEPEHIDWLAGLCLAMRQSLFASLGGFDRGYFMYAEDVDLCLRARQRGQRCLLLETPRIIHPARRRSLRSPRHLLWHLRSLFRLWRSAAYRHYRQQQRRA